MRTIDIKSQFKTYTIIIKNNLLSELKDYLDLNKQYVIISDNMIPTQYIQAVQSNIPKTLLITFPSGEASKSLYQYERIVAILQENNIKRDACIIALGGGVTGDLAGFIASTYLRGIEYIQVPTTLLAQIDSSVGGKVAINTDLAKNSLGNFYPPSTVFIDPSTLNTLNQRHFNNGMAEMIKYGMIFSKTLFDEILSLNVKENIEHFIYESVMIKKHFVENDEMDKGLRQILNYGHTYGHAYESLYGYHKYLHGEAISLGMVKVCDIIDVKIELINVLRKFNLPTTDPASDNELIPYIIKDKKNTSNYLNLIVVNNIGSANIIKKKI